MKNIPSRATIITGYDNRSLLYDTGELMLRKVDPEYFETIKLVYDIYETNKLDKMGVVVTKMDQQPNCLNHVKHITSHPFEWTANMYKDAVLFHLQLFECLDKYGLTLKDALPGNIVFNNCNPVFVDFTSLVPRDKLGDEEWLFDGIFYREPRFAVIDRMLIPFMLIPLMAFVNKDYALVRNMLSEKACNCPGGTPVWSDLYTDHTGGNYSQLSTIRNLLKKKETMDFASVIHKIFALVDNLDVDPTKSGYLDYYDNKNENFDFDDSSGWSDKQLNVQKILNKYLPEKVLDIGSNTGWFSILAANHGAEVISTDIDESSIDFLYLVAQKEKLSILPLLMSFDNLTREIYGMDCQDKVYKNRDFKGIPLFLPATTRLKADLVLCLGLLHHLILGLGREIGNVLEVLARLTGRHLLLEFISLEDKLVQDHPAFFKNIDNHSKSTYNLHIIIDEGKKFFKSVQVMDSENKARKLLLFEK